MTEKPDTSVAGIKNHLALVNQNPEVYIPANTEVLLFAIAAERDEALARVGAVWGKAVDIVDRYGEGCLRPAPGWDEEYVEAWETGGVDHTVAISSTLKELNSQDPTGQAALSAYAQRMRDEVLEEAAKVAQGFIPDSAPLDQQVVSVQIAKALRAKGRE